MVLILQIVPELDNMSLRMGLRTASAGVDIADIPPMSTEFFERPGHYWTIKEL
jgi:hypothetical protein